MSRDESERDMLEAVAMMADPDSVIAPVMCGHGDTCTTCRDRRLFGRIAQQYLDRGDTGPGSLVRCSMEFEEQRRAQPSNN